MTTTLKLNRQQLAQFLPNQQAIEAFEKLFEVAVTTTPENLDEVLSLIGSGNSSRGANLKPLLDRIEQLEQMVSRKDNLTDIQNRLEKIERYLGV